MYCNTQKITISIQSLLTAHHLSIRAPCSVRALMAAHTYMYQEEDCDSFTASVDSTARDRAAGIIDLARERARDGLGRGQVIRFKGLCGPCRFGGGNVLRSVCRIIIYFTRDVHAAEPVARRARGVIVRLCVADSIHAHRSTVGGRISLVGTARTNTTIQVIIVKKKTKKQQQRRRRNVMVPHSGKSRASMVCKQRQWGSEKEKIPRGNMQATTATASTPWAGRTRQSRQSCTPSPMGRVSERSLRSSRESGRSLRSAAAFWVTKAATRAATIDVMRMLGERKKKKKRKKSKEKETRGRVDGVKEGSSGR